MTEHILTQERLKELLNYDPKTGIFTRAVKRHKYPAGEKAGTVEFNGYIVIRISGKTYKAHRLAWLYVYGEWPDNQIDHINGIKTDNRMCNLRQVCNSENLQNLRKPRCDCSSGYMGVTFHKRVLKYQARIGIAGKRINLGYFDDPKEAHKVYLDAKRNIHPFGTI